MRAALYLRVSTDEQTVERQERELRELAARAGHEVVEVYCDNGVSGALARAKRPAFNRLHHDAVRHRFDVVMAWSVDRLGRSLQDLVEFMQHLRALNVDLILHQQGLDTSTPAGRAMYGMLAVFADFERAMIQERVRSGMRLAKVRGTKSGKPIGRPRVPEGTRAAIRNEYAAGGIGMRGLAKKYGVSLGTVQKCL